VFDEPAAPPSELTLTCGTALPSPDVAACEADEMEYQQHQQHCSQSVLTAQQEALEVASPSTPPAQCGSIPRRRASPSVPGTLPGSLETSLLYALQVRAAQRVLQRTHCIVPVPLSSAAACRALGRCMEGEATRGRPCPSSCLHGLGRLTYFFAPVSCLDTQNRLPACLLTSWLPPLHPLHARLLTSRPPARRHGGSTWCACSRWSRSATTCCWARWR
jgi:hypothetical protein